MFNSFNKKDNKINKPKNKSRLRRKIGKEIFIYKRYFYWFLNRKKFSKIDSQISFDYSVIKHKSFLLRPLKDVDMYLQHNKVTNLKIACKKINKVIIKPGEIFSIWKLVGRPYKKKGYLDGLILTNGKISKGIGGGLCQLGNLIYWMALHSPLEIKERWRHSYDVFPDINRTIPFGCGATLSFNYFDLQLFNNTNYQFQINLWLDDEYLNGEITCEKDLKLKYEIFETDHKFEHQWWGAYSRHNKIWKRIIDIEQNKTEEEFVTENNAFMMYNPMIEK